MASPLRATDYCPFEVALYHVLARDWGRARAHVDACLARFLGAWGALHRCATAARRQQLSQLPALVDLDEYVTLASSLASLATTPPHSRPALAKGASASAAAAAERLAPSSSTARFASSSRGGAAAERARVARLLAGALHSAHLTVTRSC